MLIGVPIGECLIRRMPAETFRRLCMSFDAWVVGFGASTVIRDLRIVDGSAAYLFLVAVVLDRRVAAVSLLHVRSRIASGHAAGGIRRLEGRKAVGALPLTIGVSRIRGLDDPRIADYRDIAEAELVRSRGLFVAEGRIIVRRLIEDRRYTLRSVLVSDAAYRALEGVLGRVAGADARLHV